MDIKIISAIVGLTAVTTWAVITWQSPKTGVSDTLPWHIVHTQSGSTQVLGITLNQSTVAEVEEKFATPAEISMFKSPAGNLEIEAYFDDVILNDLKAKITLTIPIPEPKISEIYERGLRISSTGSGKKVTLQTADLTYVRDKPISSLTYLPNVQLDDAILLKRFGTPNQRVREPKTNATHWLYLQHGLDITLSPTEKPIFQYVSTQDFERLSKPLLEHGEVLR